ncbi:HNH endonuclease [Leuconostoc mesenteroides]|uniref:HNH endonuclease n=1 Tax=Leuconostoc mesenteroides TaxID=1245 RepID=UPI001B8B49D1|nr:HNH endonuclease signature motif containing protein [Leuconostoc mesenteroides]MBS0941684.1 HNH endonuclease [Leuconostoc mesenteroides]
MARVKICRKPDCHNTIPYVQDNPYCEIHKAMYRPKPEFKPKSSYERKRQQHEYNANKRDKEANEFYHNKTWKHLSAGLKQQAMFTCECCGRTSTTKGYLVVDHIIPRKIDKRKQLDKDNLWVICKRCHWYKGMLEDDVYTDGLFLENIDTSKSWGKGEVRQWILDSIKRHDERNQYEEQNEQQKNENSFVWR